MEKLLERFIDKYLVKKNNMKNLIKILSLVFLFGACDSNETAEKKPVDFESLNLIERVEPPNWWSGMKTLDLQLLVYGSEINDLIPIINNSNIKLKSIKKTENPNYLFLDILISENSNPDNVEIDFYREDILVDRYGFELKKREENAENIEGFTTSDVMYLITPDRFANGDLSNDDIKEMRERPNRDDIWGLHGGDIQGVINNLDYINEMGFTTVWLNPVLENNMERASYHGYSTTDYYKIDPRFGTNELFRDLGLKSKDMGIKLVMDMIPNHCGSFHWFFLDPPMDNWFNNQYEYKRTSHRRQTVQDIYASEIDKKEHADGWFVETMPDLNQKNPIVSKYLIQNAIWWTEYAGLAGIRVDTYPYSDKDFMTDWTYALMNEYPNLNIVGEEWADTPTIISYWQRGKVNHDGYVSYLPTLMDFPLQMSFNESLTDGFSYGMGFSKPYRSLASDFLYPNPNNLLVFPDNHDMSRFFTQVNKDIDLFKMGIVFYSTIRGIPQFYYGTEIIMSPDEKRPGNHGLVRTEFPGGWPDHNKNAFTGKNLTEDEKDVQKFFKKLLNWRKNNKIIHDGKLIQFAPKDEVYSYFRILDEKMVWVILNRNNSSKTLKIERFAELISEKKFAYDFLNDNRISISDNITVEKKSALILEIE